MIVCAGAINSPQLLQLSGHWSCEAAEIARHCGVSAIWAEVGAGPAGSSRDLASVPGDRTDAQQHPGSQVGQALGRDAVSADPSRPARVFRSIRSAVLCVLRLASRCRICRSTATRCLYSHPARWQPEMGPAPGFLLCAQPCRPTSRGEYRRIASADPAQAPLIQPNSLSTDAGPRHGAIAAGRLVQRARPPPRRSRG